MKFTLLFYSLFILSALLFSCFKESTKEESKMMGAADSLPHQDSLPAPFATPSAVKNSNVIGWPADKIPLAPEGFVVTKFAEELQNPRWIYILPNGDILVAESMTKITLTKKLKAVASGKLKSAGNTQSANQITLFRDKDHDGKPEIREIFLENLHHPFGMLLIDSTFYVANTDGVVVFPYHNGETKITAKGKKIVDLPADGYNNHWTRNIVTNSTKDKLYISVGSGSNVGEHGLESEIDRANILETNLDGSQKKIYASGLRNPVGMAWEPVTRILWTAVNERDELGDMLVPDYFTSVKKGGFYGWPWSYFGQHEDPRVEEKNPDMVMKAIVPDYALGAHTASLGLAFYEKKEFPQKYQGGAFISQHGSWNSAQLVGYKVVFIPFSNGKPAGKMQDFLTGFISDAEKGEVFGRPVGIAVTTDGALLVSDDAANTIWKIKHSIKK